MDFRYANRDILKLTTQAISTTMTLEPTAKTIGKR